MPELPEVETIRKDLDSTIIDKDIISYEIYHQKSFINPQNIDIAGKIEKINRIGKYLILDIKNKATIIIHLRMTGKLILQASKDDATINKTVNYKKHLKAIFHLSDLSDLYFHDIRTFGKIEVYPYQTPLQKVKNIGIDAISPTLNLKTFQTLITSKKKTLQVLLLEQTTIAGIGNIYMQEILFDAKLSPLKYANTLTTKETKALLKSTKKILSLAILHNGTTISDFRRVDDKTGSFQNLLKIYGKSTCPTCQSPLTKIKNNGRTTTYCEKCQGRSRK